jgi:hypothetical protein
MPHGNPSPIGLCVLPEPNPNVARTVSYPSIIADTLTHYGIPFDLVEPSQCAAALASLTVLLTAGQAAEGVLPDLTDWLEAGGIWIAIGNPAAMPALLGVEQEEPSYGSWGGGVSMLGEGWLRPTVESPLTAHIRAPLHFFNGAAVRAVNGSRVLAVAEGWDADQSRPAIIETRRGSGRTLLIAPDIPGSMVRIRQGIGVTCDGVPAPDGTAPLSDGVLKSDDGAVLHWSRDRQPVDGVPGYRAFLEPVADQWAELVVRAVLWAACLSGTRLPLLWLYPRNLPAVAVLSHDSDNNEPGKAMAMLGVVARAGIRSTWCTMADGYPPDVIESIRAAGHELAMHFDAMSEGTVWSEDEFKAQHAALCRLFGERPLTNKNHYLRWEGDLEFYEWCERAGIRLDQSKGASKTGTAGFNFGTCHLFRPVRRDGSALDVWEMPTVTQDMIVFAPPQLGDALRASVLRANGIYHLLFHPAHIETAGVADALLAAVAKAREAGMEWWTGKEVAEWETARCGIRWQDYRVGEAASVEVTLASDGGLKDATVLWLDEAGDIERWGHRFTGQQSDIEPGACVTLASG